VGVDGSRGMRRPAGDIRGDQEGFIIIEVLVSAIILALVAGAVLTLITATTRGAASQRDRAVAYDLAQADQARLRTMQITKLNGLEESTEENTAANGATYKVVSKGVFVNNQAGGVSCTEENDSSDYIQLTSTVTSPALNSPVTIQSVVSPSTGSIDPTHGTLAIQTKNAAQEPVSGVSVELERTAYSRTTETQGCANFADLPAGAYNVVFRGGGTLVDEFGESEETKPNQSVSAGRSPSRAESHWDTPGTIEAEFIYVEPGTGTVQPAPIDSMWVVPQTGGKEKTFGKPSGERSATLLAAGLYPFKGVEYTVYAGSCTTNNPGAASKPENKVGIGSVEVIPGKTVRTQIHVPALQLKVESNSKAVSGATVTVTDKKCKTAGGSLVKRTFTTDANGHLVSPITGLPEAGLPFGAYEICASKKIGTKTFGAKLGEVKVENFTTGTVQPLKILEGGPACT
jgi:type II secretory pathway pseudopilin PulG